MTDVRFRFINSINLDKQDITDDPQLEVDYNPFFINRMLSYHLDTLLHAYRMDRYSELPKVYQYLYLLNKVKKAKRFTKLVRKVGQSEHDDNLSKVQEYFNFNPQKARAALSILRKDQLAIINQEQKKGGVNKK